jgi:hypothetical protein
MDVEQIQKINTLAVDLMRRGLASDREDAVRQAEAVYHSRDPEGFKSMRDTMSGVQAEGRRGDSSYTTGSSSSGNTNTNEGDLSSEKVKDILEKNTKYIISQLKAFQEKVEAMDKEIVNLRSQMSSVRASAMSAASSQGMSSVSSGNQSASGSGQREVRIQSASPEKPIPDHVVANGNANTPQGAHPRSGSYNVGDVSIEKFFYAGGKR